MLKTMTRIKPSKRWLITFSIVSFVLMAFVLPVTVTYAQSSMDKMIPEDGDNSALYNKYDSSNYAFQTVQPDRKFWQVGAKATDSINSIYDHVLSSFFYVGIQIARFFNFVAREAFEFSYMNDLITATEDIIQNVTGIQNGFIGTGVWGSGILGLLSTITLVMVIWQLARLRFLDSLQTMVSFVLAFVIAIAFFSQAGTFLKLVNEAGNDLGSMMYKGIATAGGLKPAERDGVSAISEQVWMEIVMKPYGMLQFDDADAYKKHADVVNSVLKTDPFSDARDEALKKAASTTYPAVQEVRSDEQMIILLCNTIFAVLILGLFCFWSVITIYIRLKFLIHACAMSITLLAALLPGREAGLSVIRTQFVKLIGLILQIVFTMFFLDLSLVLGHKVYSISSSPNSWFTGMLLEAVTVVAVFKYKDEIGGVFSKAVGNIPLSPKVKNTLMDEAQRWGTRKLMGKTFETVSGVFNRKEHEGVPSTFNPSAISKASDNLNDATTASMQLRYQREKEASEQVAAETSQPVQYTPFVQRVNDNMKNGTKNPFRGMDKEWKEEKSRLGEIQKDGGDVRQAILTQGVHDNMNDQQVAATIYSNDNAIRQASTFMVNRPKSAIRQMQRAGTLNKNRKLETTVNDFIMVELFERYKVEYKQAIDTAAVTGDPVKHTDFVKNMDERFKSAGLQTTNKVNNKMLSRNGRISVASQFESMPEFTKKRDDLLRANDAFRKATAPKEGIPAPVAPVSIPAPAAPASVLKSMPSLPSATSKLDMGPIILKGQPEVQADLDMSRVKLPGNLQQSMNDAKSKLANTASFDVGDRLEINTETNVQVFTTLKQRVTNEVSTDLDGLNNELKVMQRANGKKLAAAVGTADTENIVKKNVMTAQQSRKQKQRPTVE